MSNVAELVDRRPMDVGGPYLRVFGGVSIEFAGEPVSIGGPRQRRLLALLAARSGSVVSNDWLAEYLWDDDDRPEAVERAIRTYVSRLRQALPDVATAWIETAASGYSLIAPIEVVEHQRFFALRERSRRARDAEDPQTALALLDEALDLWRGDPFRELEDLDWAQADIEQLRLDRLEMQEERWEAALALGRHTQITGELAAFNAEHGLRDRAVRQYALALYRSGRTVEALRVLGAHRSILANESGLDPSPAVVQLEASLLAGDPSLDVDKSGRPLRGYRLLNEIGSGAFSIVWRAMQPSVGREVAVKQIRSELATQPEFIRRFEAEAQMVARMEHHHIVPLIDFWRDPDSAYLVMRWMRGGTLEQRLDRGVLTVEETLRLAGQVGSALTVAHRNGVVHRDVKAANVLFDEHGNAFLADFGIALEVAASSGPEAALSPGSPAYSSPEQIRQERLGPEADIFSLGVVLYECLTGGLPFSNFSAQDLLDRQLSDPYPEISASRPDIPQSLSDAIAKATEKDAADRFATVDEFLAALVVETDVSQDSVTIRTGPDESLDNPYRGLRAFDSDDADNFFGRQRLVSELIARLAGTSIQSRCLVVVGPSGSGKSSVVRAGLIPELRAGAVAGSDEWFVTTMVPGNSPFESLEAALLRIAVNPPPSLLDQLEDGDRGILRSVRRCLGSDDQKVLLVIDQFEEIFTGSSTEQSTQFISALSVAVSESKSSLRLVATLRADFYDRPLQHAIFAAILKQTAVDVTPLAPDELEEAIIKPARQQGVEFEPGLPARVVAGTVGQPSPLPLLQYALSELFERRDGSMITAAAYEEIGGMTGALAARAEAIHSHANAEQQSAMRRLFGHMMSPDEATSDVRRRVSISDFDDDPPAMQVLQQLGAARLLSFDRDASTREPTVEVAHEALFREWPRLVDWLRADKQLLRTAAEVSAAANAWSDSGREVTDLYRGGRLEQAIDLATINPRRFRPIDSEFIEASRRHADGERQSEKRRLKRLRRLVSGTAVALVLALVAGGVALSQRNDARAATERAELATLISGSAAQRTEDPEVALLLALEAHRRSVQPATEQAVLGALALGQVTTRESKIGPPYGASESCDLASTNGTTDFAQSGDMLISRDTITEKVTDYGPSPATCVIWHADLRANKRWASSPDGLDWWFGPLDGPWEVEVNYDEPQYPLVYESLESNQFRLIRDVNFGATVNLVDMSTGDTVGMPVRGGPELFDGWGNEDGSLIAASFGERSGLIGQESNGETVLIDGDTGDVIHRVVTDSPVFSAAFDDEQNQLLAVPNDGSLITVDVESGEVISQVQHGLTTDVLDLEILSDGTVMVVSIGAVGWIDRWQGPTRPTAPLRDVQGAIARPDGKVWTMGIGGMVASVLNFGGSALIENSWDIYPFANIAFNAGRGGFLNQAGAAEVVELSTGQRTQYSLRFEDGEALEPLKIYPEVDGIVGITTDGLVFRSIGDRVVDTIDLGWWSGGTRYLDRWAIVHPDANDLTHVTVLDLGSGGLKEVISVPVAFAKEAHPNPDGGVFVFLEDGTLKTFDEEGTLVLEAETPAEQVTIITFDPTIEKLAVSDLIGGSWLINPTTGDAEILANDGLVSNMGFARNGELLAITGSDGTVRLWDVATNSNAGLVWDGTGANLGSPSWFDEATQSIWVNSSGKLLQIPVNPEQWIEKACDLVGRELSSEEWGRFVPGDTAQRPACQ